ncbi:MAG: hypothetical protein DMF63_14335 [Acidobacteria bacterium]|nr:MAG: hypothetical protein DMF63_14335 [Acidobacteriota bacterium]
MYWHGHFQSAFFEEWIDQGLPAPERYSRDYKRRLSEIRFAADVNRGKSPALDPPLLDSVYGFGVLVGQIFGELLGISGPRLESAADLCGRFNLGISLFDYVCDETGGHRSIARIPVFQQFVGSKFDETHRLDPVEKFLSELATGILTDIHQLRPARARQPGGLWNALQKMFRAELAMSETGFNGFHDTELIRKALKLKSEEPFRIMAECVALSGEIRDRHGLAAARSLGRSVGNCYWLIDDAKDVWEDLRNNRWNIFLLHAAKNSPGIFEREIDSLTEVRLMKLWEASNVAERLSKKATRGLRKVLDDRDVPSQNRQQALGYMAASLSNWLKFD